MRWRDPEEEEGDGEGAEAVVGEREEAVVGEGEVVPMDILET